MLKNPKQYSVFVAEDKDKDNKIIKFYYFIDLWPYLYVQDLVVNEETVGKGVGSAIIQHIIHWSCSTSWFWKKPWKKKFKQKKFSIALKYSFWIGIPLKQNNLFFEMK